MCSQKLGANKAMYPPENHVGAQPNSPEQLCALQNDRDNGAMVSDGEGIVAQDIDCGPAQHCGWREGGSRRRQRERGMKKC